MLNKLAIKRKFETISQYINEVQKVLEFSDKEIKKDFTKLRTLERNFQLIVDTIVGINLHIIARKNLESPDDYQGTFEILASNDILPNDFAFRIAPAVGLRNALVHKYENVDLLLSVRTLRKEKEDFKKYIILINEYIKKEK